MLLSALFVLSANFIANYLKITTINYLKITTMGAKLLKVKEVLLLFKHSKKQKMQFKTTAKYLHKSKTFIRKWIKYFWRLGGMMMIYRNRE